MTMSSQYPLANDIEGNPVVVPPEAVAWRVRRGGGRRGRPRTMFDAETGRQLEVPLGSTLEDLIESGCSAGRYRLDAIDADGRLIAGVTAITEIGRDMAESEEEEETRSGDPFNRLVQLVAQLVDTNCRAMEALASAFGSVRPAETAPIPSGEPASAPAMKPDQLAQLTELAKGIFDAFKGSRASSAGGGVEA